MGLYDNLTADHPRIAQTLDPGFLPAVLCNRAYRAAAVTANGPIVGVAVERNDGLVTRRDVQVIPLGGDNDAETFEFVERHVKFLLWAMGGWKIVTCGPDAITSHIQAAYAEGGARAFDANLMAGVYDETFTVDVVDALDDMPLDNQSSMSVGGNLDGCRIGFDLGASDYKLAAVNEGEPVFSTEIRWDPVAQDDPEYHYKRIQEGFELAASKLPRVDAIGGSSAGIYVANRVKVASLFRSVPRDVFDARVKDMFLRLRDEWGVPLVVVNDGDVTALAGAMSLEADAMLGIAMGSSEAVGYIDDKGCITGWLNELAFAPVDFSADAAVDEWSGDRGCGALYFSQQAVNKLAPSAGFAFPEEMALPDRLKAVQARANEGDENALAIFRTIGVYLAYALAHYRDYYAFDNVLLLGRVTSGKGGELILSTAKETLAEVFPEVADAVAIHVPDEKSRRVGQAVAAASLPEIE